MTINVRGLIRGGINTLNKDTDVVIVRQEGVTNTNFQPTPNLLPPEAATAQIQPLKTSDLQHVNNFNTSKTYQVLYINGDWNSLQRATQKGGDLIYFDGFEWLVNSLPEKYVRDSFPWTKVMVVLQKAMAAPTVP